MATHKSRLTYDDVVATLPTLAPDEQISLLEALSSVLRKALQPPARLHTLSELEGLGSELWAKVNAADYVRQERESWN
jgi:hypothetical protein